MIETKRLRLRPCTDADKSAFATILNTPAMMAELGGVTSREAVDALVDKRIAGQARRGCSYWAVELRDTGELIGTAGIRIADNYPGTPVDGAYEIGWRIAEAHWRKGYAREAAQASIDWGWANTSAPRILSWTTAGNAASLAVMRSLGMERRPDLDFRRPGSQPDDPLAAQLVDAIERPL